MTYPNQPYPPQAPPQQPGYPQQPAAPQGYPPAQPQYPQQPPQGYPQQQGYGQQAPPQAAPPRPPLPRTTAADYLEQPSMGGLSLQFPAMGTRHTGIVARDLGDADFPPQTESDGVTPKRFRDGRIMVRMVVPLNVRPDQRHTDGRATLSVQGQMSEALKQAMSAAGAGHLNGVPEAGAEITVAWTGQIPPKNPMFNPTKVYEVVYRRPAGAVPGAQGNGQAAQEQPPWTPPIAEQAPGPVAQIPAQVAQQYAGVQAAGQQPQQQPWNAQAGMQQYAPEMQQPQQPPAPQMPAQPQAPGMAGPAQQVAAATQAAQAAGQVAQQAQAPQAPAMAPPPGMPPYTAALMKQATGQQLTAEDQAALAAGPPQ